MKIKSVHIHSKIGIIILIPFFFWECASLPKRYPDRYSLNKEIITQDGEEVKEKEVLALSVFPPNKKIFNIPFKQSVYLMGKKNPDSLFNKWLLEKPKRKKKYNTLLSEKQVIQLKKYYVNLNKWLLKQGEPPVWFSPDEAKDNQKLFTQYYKNKGFFQAKVTYEIDTLPKNKINIRYQVEKNSPFILDTVSTQISSADLKKIFVKNRSQSFIKKGEVFNANIFNLEVARLTRLFGNNGIPNFKPKNIHFKVYVDSLWKRTNIPVTLLIDNPQKRVEDSLIALPYKIKKINKVSINIINTKESISSLNDSIEYKGVTLRFKDYLKYKPKSLIDRLGLEKNQIYSDSIRKTTLSYFNELESFKYPFLKYNQVSENSDLLNAEITLTSRQKFSTGFELNLLHSNIERFGTKLGYSLIIRNVFGNTEILEFSNDLNIGSSQNVVKNTTAFFNLVEISGRLNLKIPKLLLPLKLFSLNQKNKVNRTLVGLGISFQKNIGLDKQNFSNTFQYQWSPKPQKNLSLNLINVEFVSNRNISNYFNVYRSSFNRLNQIARLTNHNSLLDQNGNLEVPMGTAQFITNVLNGELGFAPDSSLYNEVSVINERQQRLSANNLIVGSSFSYTNSNKQGLSDENFSQVKFKLETVGSLLNTFLKLANTPKQENGFRKFLDVFPSQFAKAEINYIQHWQVGRKRVVAFRFFTGIAIPFGNSNAIPFIRSYYAGGSNDNRAWRVYQVGPGTSSQRNEFNEANFKLAFNLEYRYPIIDSLNGAIFIDAGNIWNVLDASLEPDSRLTSFYDLTQLAVGTGIGLRYDLNFFVIRADLGIKTYNPALSKANRLGFSGSVFNVGINYPF